MKKIKMSIVRKWLRLLLGLLFIALSLWLFYQTLGIRLLFLNVTLGKICRYWFIAAILGLILGGSGLWSILRKSGNKEPEAMPVEENKEQKTETQVQTDAEVTE